MAKHWLKRTALSALLLAALAGCSGPPAEAFGERVLIANPITLGVEPIAMPLPAGGIRSDGGFDALCLSLAPGYAVATEPGASGCVIAGAAGERITVSARFELAQSHFSPRTCHQSTVRSAGQPQTKVCLRNPNVPEREFVYRAIELRASAPLPVNRIDWRDAPGGAGQPSVW